MRVPLLGLGVLAAGVLLCVASLVATDRALKTVETPTAAAATDGTMVGMDMSSGSTRARSKARALPAPHPRTPPRSPRRTRRTPPRCRP